MKNMKDTYEFGKLGQRIGQTGPIDFRRNLDQEPLVPRTEAPTTSDSSPDDDKPD